MCQNTEEYPNRVIATVPQLKYLDWVKITDEARVEARIKFTAIVDKLEFTEAERQRKEQEASEAIRFAEDLIENGIPEMGRDMWFDRIFLNLSNTSTLSTVPGFDEAIVVLKQHFEACSKPIKEAAYTCTKSRVEIQQAIETALSEGRQERLGGQSQPLIEAWVAEKDALLDEMDESQTSASQSMKVRKPQVCLCFLPAVV